MGLFYYGVEVRWRDGTREMMKYDTEEQASAAYEYQFVENWSENKNAAYVGKRINWRFLFWGWLFGP